MLCLGLRIVKSPELDEEAMTTEEKDKRKAEPEAKEQSDIEEVEAEAKPGNRYQRRGADLLLSIAHDALDFHKSIADAHRTEEYARDCTRIMGKLNKQWEKKELARSYIPTTFPDEIRPKDNLVWKKGGSRRRAYTGREVAEAEEAKQRQTKRKESIEQDKRQRYNKLQVEEAEDKGIQDLIIKLNYAYYNSVRV